MADDDLDDNIKPFAQADAAALHAAFGAAGASEEARHYLRKQSVLADLQIDTLQKQDKFETSHLRWRRFSDQMKGMGQIMLVAVGALFVLAIAAAFWTAAHDDGLVIDAFKVPPDMAAKGLTGDVVANQFLDRLTQMQAETDSSRAPDTYASDWASGIKVYIPNTGLSVGDAYRYLAGWLGNQTHISGEIYHTAKGIAVTARSGGNSGVTFQGDESDLPKLMRQAAESVYHQTQPFRYAVYVGAAHPAPQGSIEEANLLGDLALNGPPSEKPWAYTVWVYGALAEDNLPEALRRARTAVSYDPDLPLAIGNLSGFEKIAGHDALAIADAQRTLKSLDGSGARKIIPRAAAAYPPQFEALLAEESGDWNAALAQYEKMRALADFEGLHWNSLYASAADLALLHDLRASRAMENDSDVALELRSNQGFGWQLPGFSWPGFTRAAMLGDWMGARRDLLSVLDTAPAKLISSKLGNRMQIWPWLALADAHVGRQAEAWSLIGQTPLDCYDCLRVRGQIDATQRNWFGAGFWFSGAVQQAPSIPFAYSEWGSMLMGHGDFDGAIAKFTMANQKGPHFADPLEMWGEALIAKNRSDLALAKFEEAAKYAPNWGRLHLKWGEALWWSGDKDDARKQFAAAASLDLTPSEKSERARVMHG